MEYDRVLDDDFEAVLFDGEMEYVDDYGLYDDEENGFIDHELTYPDRESRFGASATRKKVKWYQTILRTAGGYLNLPIDGNHNNAEARNAFRRFQQRHGLRTKGSLTVESNFALTQIALETIALRRIPNKLGKKNNALRIAIKEFQGHYGLTPDGKVGPETQQVMMDVLLGRRPSGTQFVHPQLGVGVSTISREASTPDDKTERFSGTRDSFLASQKPKGVVGADNRKAVEKTTGIPSRYVCLLRHRYRMSRKLTHKIVNFDVQFGGTGVLVSPRHVLTAAHTVDTIVEQTGPGNKTTLHNVPSAITTVFPGFNGRYLNILERRPFGKTKSTFFWIPDCYRNPLFLSFDDKFNVFGNNCDIALLGLNEPVTSGFWGDREGFEIVATTPVALQGKRAYALGYPKEIPTGGFPRHWIQYRCRGKIDRQLAPVDIRRKLDVEEPNRFIHDLDTTVGHSGGPMWTTLTRNRRKIRRLMGIPTNTITLTPNTGGPLARFNIGMALTDEIFLMIAKVAPKTFHYSGRRLVVK